MVWMVFHNISLWIVAIRSYRFRYGTTNAMSGHFMQSVYPSIWQPLKYVT